MSIHKGTSKLPSSTQGPPERDTFGTKEALPASDYQELCVQRLGQQNCSASRPNVQRQLRLVVMSVGRSDFDCFWKGLFDPSYVRYSAPSVRERLPTCGSVESNKRAIIAAI